MQTLRLHISYTCRIMNGALESLAPSKLLRSRCEVGMITWTHHLDQKPYIGVAYVWLCHVPEM